MINRNKLKKGLPFCSFLPAVFLTGGIAVSLSGYTAPVLNTEIDSLSITETAVTTKQAKQKTETKTTAAEKSLTVTPMSASAAYKDGTYTGTGTGFAGPITVEVVIQDGKIQDITIVSTSDDTPYINAASALLQRIVAAQNTNVDTVSGATYSSVGLIEAVRDALKKAGGDSSSDAALPTLSASKKGQTSSGGAAPTVSAVTEPALYRDGSYTGTGTGFAGPITVKVLVENGKITDISIVSTSDDSPYIQSASALLNNIIAMQSTNVDAISGATYSSAGLIEAVRNALQAAGADPAETTTAVTTATKKRQTQTKAVAAAGSFPYPDGVYTGSGEGYRGETTVKLSLKNGRIETIVILSTDDDEAFFKRAEAVIDAVLQKQSTDVDAVSGATFSSEGILEAITQALNAAEKAANKGTSVKTTTVSTTTSVSKTTIGTGSGSSMETTTTESAVRKYADGTYTGMVICYPDENEEFLPYTISLIVCIENDVITEIKDIQAGGADYDTLNDWYMDRATNGTTKLAGVVAQIKEQQSTDKIDAVSGATCSSYSIREAVEEALHVAEEQLVS